MRHKGISIRQFIALHREAIDETIWSRLHHVPRTASCYCPKSGTDHYHTEVRRLNDEERRLWILNDEGLYLWAKSEGVNI